MNNLEKQTSVPKAYAVIGVVALYFFFIILNLGGQLLTNIAGFVIPAYYSTAALFSATKEDDTQWLTVRNPFTRRWKATVKRLLTVMTVLGRFRLLHVRFPVSVTRPQLD